MAEDTGRTILSWQDDAGQTRYVLFDVVETVNHGSGVNVSEAPIESGDIVSDHAFNTPDVVVISGLVSNTPLPSNPGVGEANDLTGRSAFMRPTNITFDLPKPGFRPSTLVGPGGLTRLATGAVGDLLDPQQNTAAGVYKADSYLDRVQEMHDILRGAKRRFRRIRVETEIYSYDNMVIRSMNIPEEIESGTARAFQIELKEIFTASSTTVEAPQPAEIRGQPPKAATKSPVPAKNPNEKEDKAKKYKSGLSRIAGALFDNVGK